MHRNSILKGKFFIKHKQRIQNTGDRRQNENQKTRIQETPFRRQNENRETRIQKSGDRRQNENQRTRIQQTEYRSQKKTEKVRRRNRRNQAGHKDIVPIELRFVLPPPAFCLLNSVFCTGFYTSVFCLLFLILSSVFSILSSVFCF
jgi:hypothetical protein